MTPKVTSYQSLVYEIAWSRLEVLQLEYESSCRNPAVPLGDIRRVLRSRFHLCLLLTTFPLHSN